MKKSLTLFIFLTILLSANNIFCSENRIDLEKKPLLLEKTCYEDLEASISERLDFLETELKNREQLLLCLMKATSNQEIALKRLENANVGNIQHLSLEQTILKDSLSIVDQQLIREIKATVKEEQSIQKIMAIVIEQKAIIAQQTAMLAEQKKTSDKQELSLQTLSQKLESLGKLITNQKNNESQTISGEPIVSISETEQDSSPIKVLNNWSRKNLLTLSLALSALLIFMSYKMAPLESIHQLLA